MPVCSRRSTTRSSWSIVNGLGGRPVPRRYHRQPKREDDGGRCQQASRSDRLHRLAASMGRRAILQLGSDAIAGSQRTSRPRSPLPEHSSTPHPSCCSHAVLRGQREFRNRFSTSQQRSLDREGCGRSRPHGALISGGPSATPKMDSLCTADCVHVRARSL